MARKGQRFLLVEAKGRSRRDRVGGVYELIGRLAALRMTDDADREYGMLIPDTWSTVLPPRRQSLDWLKVFLIERETGRIEEATLPPREPDT